MPARPSPDAAWNVVTTRPVSSHARVEHREHVDHRHHRGAGVGDDPAGPVGDLARVDLGDDERHVGVGAEDGAVVDGHDPAGCRQLDPLAGDARRDVEDRDVEAVEELRRQRLDDDVLPRDPEHRADVLRAGGEAHVGPVAVAGRQDVEDDPADGAGDAHDTERRSPVSPASRLGRHHVSGRCPRRRRPRPRWSRGRRPCARPAPPSSSRSSRVMTEMRISEVEIISMFTPAFARALKNVAETPGLRAHAGPDERQLADLVVVLDRREADVVLDALERLDGGGAVGLGQRERDVGEAGVGGRDVLDDHVDVDLRPRSPPRRSAAAMPVRSGTPTTVTLASLRSWATPAMIGASTASPSVLAGP